MESLQTDPKIEIYFKSTGAIQVLDHCSITSLDNKEIFLKSAKLLISLPVMTHMKQMFYTCCCHKKYSIFLNAYCILYRSNIGTSSSITIDIMNQKYS